MKPDYSEFNPALDSRIPPLFPFKGHLWAFMRCVLFHPDYAPFIPFGEQFTLATKIVNEYKNHILTVGDIYYSVACYVEKKDPTPRGVTRAVLLSPTTKIPLSHSAIGGLLNDEDLQPEITGQKITDLFETAPASSPKGETNTIQQLWENSESGTIYGSQFIATHRNNVPSNRESEQATQKFSIDIQMGNLFEDVSEEETAHLSRQNVSSAIQTENIQSGIFTTGKSDSTARSDKILLGGLFTPAKKEEKSSPTPQAVKSKLSLRGLFNKEK
jgi:hypothetical protein